MTFYAVLTILLRDFFSDSVLPECHAEMEYVSMLSYTSVEHHQDAGGE